MSAARKFTGEKLRCLREDYKKLQSYRKVAAKNNTNKETVRFSLNPKAREKHKEHTAVYLGSNLERVRRSNRKATKKYKERNLEKVRGMYRANKKRFGKAHPEIIMFRNARAKSRHLGLSFNLQPEDVVIPALCPVLSIPLIRGKKRTDNTPSLDQIDRTRGYVKGNVAVISWRANRLKNDGTLAEITAIAAYMRRNERTHE